MAKVLTELEVESIGRSGNTIVANRCCTKARAEALNCVVSAPSGAASNQLVTGVSKAVEYALNGPDNLTLSKDQTSGSFGIVSLADGVYTNISVSGGQYVSITNVEYPASGTTNAAIISFSYSGGSYTSSYIYVLQTASGNSKTISLYKNG